MCKTHLGKQIKKYREQSKLSQLDLAVMIEVEQSNVSNWEKGKYLPTLTNLVKIADIFGLKVWALLKEIDL